MKNKFSIAILLLIKISFDIVILTYPIEKIDTLTLVDDTYLSLTIAKNIADGKGLQYGKEQVSGFQPLYVLVMVPVYLIIKDNIISPIYIALIILALMDLFSIYVIFKLIKLFCKNDIVPVVVTFLYVITPACIRTPLNGLETPLSFFFLCLVFYFIAKFNNVILSQIKNFKYVFVGIILGFSYLARIDNVFLIIAALIFLITKLFKEKQKTIFILNKIFVSLSGLLLIILPWHIYLYAKTGDIYPVSGKSVRLQAYQYFSDYNVFNRIFILFQKSIISIFTNYFLVLFLIILFFLIIFLNKRKIRQRFFSSFSLPSVSLLVYMVLLFGAYTFYIPAYWHFARYFFPLILPLLLLLALILDTVFSSIEQENLKRTLVQSLIILMLFVNVTRPGFYRLFFEKEVTRDGYMDIAIWANNNLKEGTRLGALQTGALGYFANKLEVTNLDGVVNKSAYLAITDKNLMSYIKSDGIELLLLWDINYKFIVDNSIDFKNSNLTLLKSPNEIKSWGYKWYLYRVNY
jgi:hypothetical protein